MLQCLEQKSLCLLPTLTVGISLQLYGESLIEHKIRQDLAKSHTQKADIRYAALDSRTIRCKLYQKKVRGSHHPRNIQSVAMRAEFGRLPICVNECLILTSGNDAHIVT